MQRHFTKLGYTNADPEFAPHESDKHGFYKLEKSGHYYFAKYSKDSSVRQSSIQTDIWWCRTIRELREKHGMLLRTPEIVDYGDDWYVAQWIEGKPSVQPTDDASKLDHYLEDYARCLGALDAIKPEWITTSPPPADSSTPYDHIDRKWEKWSEKPIQEGLLTTAEVEQARQLLGDYQHHITPQLQHGDFVPWHILIDANQDWWLIDGEHANLQKPRFYDLAYMYSRIFTRLHSAKHAAQLLTAFLHHSGESIETVYPALLPVMTSRAIGMHFDAVNDLYHSDYGAQARDLLNRCLSRDPARLF